MAGIENIIYRRGSALPVRNSFFNRYLFAKVLTSIITNSKEIKSNIFQRNPRIIKEEKVQIIYNGIDLDNWPSIDFFNSKREENKYLTLGNAGRLVAQKGQEFLIKVAKQLKDKGISFRLYIAGSGELEKTLKNACRVNDLEEEIIFLDFVEDMTEFLRDLDIYLSTSLHEGSSHVIIEAMGAGKPIVAFDVSSMPELIENGETGFLVTFGDTEKFAEKIIELKNNPKDLERMGKNARIEVEKNFNFKSNIIKVLELIEK
jgi:glycosyltransferase involved in cell wall biosynthesis